MHTITNTLAVEHSAFLTVFNQIEQLLPRLARLDEVKMLAELVEGLLEEHGDKEENLAYVALDHVLEDRGLVTSLYQDHQEIDQRLARIKSATDLATARRLLEAVLAATRKHFQREEHLLFPLIEKTLRPETLAELGRAAINRPAPAA